MESNVPIRDPSVFAPDYQPPELAFRGSHLTHLAMALRQARPTAPLGRFTPFLYGESGTGKTAVITRVLRELGGKVTSATVDCFEARTPHAVLEAVISQLHVSQGLKAVRYGLLDLPKVSTARNREKLRRFARDNPLILVLEDIDRMAPKAREETLYHLCDLSGVALVLTARPTDAIHELDFRVSSRLSTVGIEFPPYSKEQLRHILRERAVLGLAPGSWNAKLLGLIAEVSFGNARTAIGALNKLAVQAEYEGRPRLSLSEMQKAVAWTRNASVMARLRGLNRHQFALYQVVLKRREVTSPDLKKAYVSFCEKSGLRPVATRTIRLYMNELSLRGLVSQEPAAEARGEAKLFRTGQSP
jgi:cell division control protein 6